MACSVSVASEACSGIVKVCRSPDCSVLRSLQWLPRVATTSNPNRTKIAATSRPDSCLSRCDICGQLVRHADALQAFQAKRCEVFTFQMQGHSFRQVRQCLIEGFALRYHSDLMTVDDVRVAVLRDERVYRVALRTPDRRRSGRRRRRWCDSPATLTVLRQ